MAGVEEHDKVIVTVRKLNELAYEDIVNRLQHKRWNVVFKLAFTLFRSYNSSQLQHNDNEWKANYERIVKWAKQNNVVQGRG